MSSIRLCTYDRSEALSGTAVKQVSDLYIRNSLLSVAGYFE